MNAPILQTQFFNFRVVGESTWVVPTLPTEGSDGINFSSSWSVLNVQGSTEGMSAFNYVNNPTIPINLKFHEDLWREFNITSHSYEDTIAKLASLQYPSSEVKGDAETIVPPYVIISFKGFYFRGYFTTMRITQSGPLRKNSKGVIYNPICEISASFTIVKSSSPKSSDIANAFKTTFQ